MSSTPQSAIANHLNMKLNEQVHHPRKRTLSTMSTLSSRSSKIAVQSKADASVVVTTRLPHQDTYGAFIPTASAASTLSRLSPKPSAKGLSFLRTRTRPTLPWLDSSFDGGASSSNTSPSCDSPSSIPSISRTSSYTDSSSYASPTPDSASDTASAARPIHRARKQQPSTELNPILASLERKSRLCSFKTQCATCGKPGNDYPRCGRCAEMWCSRECRTKGGKRHVCAVTT